MSLNSLTDLLLDAVCIVDAEGRFVSVSPAGERIFGYRPEEMAGRNMLEFIAPFDRERTLAAAGRVMAGQSHLHFENCYVRKDGELVHLMWSARWSEADQLRIAVARDVTALKRAEATHAALYAISEATHVTDKLPELCEKLHRIVDTLLPAPNLAVVFQDDKRGPLDVPYLVDSRGDTAAAVASSALCAAVMGSGQPLLLTPDQLAHYPEPWREAFQADWQCWLGVPLNSPKGTIGALILKRYAGERAYSDADRELLHYVSNQIATAIERTQFYARQQYNAQYDPLTGLTNRVLLQDRLTTAFARARREHGRLSLLFLDLDNFKQVNDTLGHAAGDKLLQEMAARIRHCVRETDTVARVGGDEFVVLLESLTEAKNVQRTLEHLRAALQAPVEIDGHILHVEASVGLAHYPDHGDSAAQLLKHADDAMYEAKKAKRQATSAP